MGPHGVRPGSVDHGEEAAGGLVERESSVLPGRALAESCQPLHVAPDRSRIRLMLFRQRVRLGGLFPRQIESLRDRIEHRVACRTELLGGRPLGAWCDRRRGRRRGPRGRHRSDVVHAS